MNTNYVSVGGGEGDGQAVFTTMRPPGCNLVVSDSGLVTLLDYWRPKWEQKYKVGLFQNNAYPSLTWTKLSPVPCNFSGYSGLMLSFGWSAAVINNTRAVTEANALLWTHDGGPVGNFVYGYYVVDTAGELIWAERFCPAPQWVFKFGTKVRVVPSFTLRNDIPE